MKITLSTNLSNPSQDNKPEWKIARWVIVLALVFCGPAAEAFPLVNIDFNGGGDPTESTGAGVLGPGLTAWEGISLGLGGATNPSTAGPLFGSRMNVNVVEAMSDTSAWVGDPKLFDGLLDPERIIVDLENLIPGHTYTLAVYAGSVINPSFRIQVQGVAKYQGISSGTLPGVEDQDYSLFHGIVANGAGTIRVIVEESTPSLNAMLCAIQISGPFVGANPDAAIGANPTSLRGRGRISRSGGGQTASGVSKRRRLKRFYAEAGYLHSLTGGRFLVNGRRSDRKWKVAYFDTTTGRSNITARATSGGHMTDSSHSSASPMKMVIETRPTNRGRRSRRPFVASLQVHNGAYASMWDRVQARVRAK